VLEREARYQHAISDNRAVRCQGSDYIHRSYCANRYSPFCVNLGAKRIARLKDYYRMVLQNCSRTVFHFDDEKYLRIDSHIHRMLTTGAQQPECRWSTGRGRGGTCEETTVVANPVIDQRSAYLISHLLLESYTTGGSRSIRLQPPNVVSRLTRLTSLRQPLRDTQSTCTAAHPRQENEASATRSLPESVNGATWSDGDLISMCGMLRVVTWP
jgi:hypothetical protein